jgi:diguanylate cyclase (GGDEF)-like protein
MGSGPNETGPLDMTTEKNEQNSKKSAPLQSVENSKRAEIKLAYILDLPDSSADDLSRSLALVGFSPRLFTDKDALIASAKAHTPACLILGDAAPMESYETVIQELNEFRARKIPVLIARKDDTAENRLIAARLKTDGYYAKPVNAAKIVEEIDKRIEIRSGSNPFRVLLVDDDRSQASEHANYLKRAGMDVQIVSHPSKVLARISDFDPDILVAERDTPDFPAVDIAGMLRQHDAHHWIPVIILADYIDATLRLEAIRQGTVDIIPKPVSAPVLTSSVAGAIERARMMKSMMLSDSLTGLYNQTTMKKMLAAEVAQSIRDKQTCCLVMFDLDDFKNINNTYGHPVGDKVLKSLADLLRNSFRKSDLFGRFGGEEFIALLPNTPATGALIVVNRIREEFEKIIHHAPDGENFNATLSIGICERTGAMTAEDMTTKAEQAVLGAKRAGKNQASVA